MVIGLTAMALGGAALGAGGGLLSGALGKSSSSRQRRRVRSGINMGLQQSGREIGAFVNSPEIDAMRKFLHGLYGIQPGAEGRAGGLGQAQTLQGVSVVDPDAPTAGMKFKALGKQGARAVSQATKDIAEYSRAKNLAESGMELSPAEQARIDATLSEDKAGELSKSLAGMSGVEQNWVARLLQEREGIGADDFNQIVGGLRETAGLEPLAQQGGGGADFSAALDPSINPAIGNFQKGLQQAQASRGLFASNAAAAAEGSGMAAFLFNQQQAMLPALQNLASLDIGAFAQSVQANRINQQTSLFTGGGTVAGPSAAQQALQGGLSGLFAGASMGINAFGGSSLFGAAPQAQGTDGGNPLSGFNPMGGKFTAKSIAGMPDPTFQGPMPIQSNMGADFVGPLLPGQIRR